MAWITSLKIVLISSGVVALALAMKLSIPLVLEFISSHVPLMCSSFRSLLRPPYLYVLINCIIITIAASSRFHHKQSHQPKVHSETDSGVLETPTTVYEQRDFEPAENNAFVEAEPEPQVEDKLVVSRSTWTPPQSEMNSDETYLPVAAEKPMVSEGFGHREPAGLSPVVSEVGSAVSTEAENEPEVEDDRAHKDVDELVVSRSTWTPPAKRAINSDEIYLPEQKPLVSVRFGHRKPARSGPEVGRPLRVSKPKRNDTLENTWKAITEGRSMPLSRHMKKIETWENQDRQIINVDSAAVETSSAMLKTETFKDRTNQPQLTAVAVSSSIGTTAGKLRKEPSLGQDELNRRVEAFINKFNEEMRLQRQESLNQYMEMINR